MGDKKLKKLSVLVVLMVGLGLVLPTYATFAQAPQGLQKISAGAKAAAGGAGLVSAGGNDLMTLIGQLIGAVMGLVGVLLFGYMVYGGFKWMTAAGDAKAVTDAQAIIRNAIIGLVIIVAAYSISSYVLTRLADVTNPNVQTQNNPPK